MHDTKVDSHKHATEAKENEQATIAGKLILMRQITLEVPVNSPISSGLKKMGVKEKQPLTKLRDVTYYIALKGRPFTNSKDLVDLQNYIERSFNLVHMRMKKVAGTSSTLSQNFSSRITYIKNF